MHVIIWSILHEENEFSESNLDTQDSLLAVGPGHTDSNIFPI